MVRVLKIEAPKLIEEAMRLVKQLNSLKENKDNQKEVAELRGRLDKIKGHLQKGSNASSYNYYPDIDDEQFSSKLLSKKEFGRSKYKKVQSDIGYDALVHERCNADGDFQLTPNQVFLKTFMSPLTHYNSLLLFHGVGVGKTATALSIAEQFKSVYSKKILIIAPTNLQKNFEKQMFDVQRYSQDRSGKNQCIAPNLLKLIPDHRNLSDDIVEKKAHHLIRSQYEFFGFLGFAIFVDSIKAAAAASEPIQAKVEQAIVDRIKETFSNRVIIIDEVHNARTESKGEHGNADGKKEKRVPPILLEVIKHAENVKLILLTATPMFNDAKELIWLLNLLMANEKRQMLELKQVFDKNGWLTIQGKQIIGKSTRGLVSYMRGENPFAFPLRMYPSINNDHRILKKSEIPTHAFHTNGEIAESDRLQSLPILKCVMGEYQSKLYTSIRPDHDEPDDADVDDDIEAKDDDKNTIAKMQQVSNIVYPQIGADKALPYGKNAFYSCFNRDTKSKSFQVSYNPVVVKGHGEFLKHAHVGQYSAKIARIVEYIKSAKGIVYVYSQYLYSGIIPLAIALEHAGFHKTGGSNILKPTNKVGNNGHYSILTNDRSICTDIQKEIDVIKSPDNLRGERVKVILGTAVSTEGIDFKRIREVHFLEPWYHLNKVEQVVGRASRMCSHTLLPPAERNVTIYHHAAIPPDYDGRRESYDLKVYRVAENKQAKINQAEEMIISNSIDCHLNTNTMHYDPLELNMKLVVETSQGIVIPSYPVGDDQQNPRFHRIQCTPLINQTAIANDARTFGVAHFSDETYRYEHAVDKLFTGLRVTLRYADITRAIKDSRMILDFDEDVLKYTLEHLIAARKPLTNGVLTYSGTHYILIPPADVFKRSFTSRKVTQQVDAMILHLMSHNKDTAHSVRESDLVNMSDKIASDVAEFQKKVFSHGDLTRQVVDYVVDRLVHSDLVSVNLAFMESTKQIDQWATESMFESGILFKGGGDTLYLRSPFYLNKSFAIERATGQFMEITDDYTQHQDYMRAFEQTGVYKQSKSQSLKSFSGFMDIKPPFFKVFGSRPHSTGSYCMHHGDFSVPELEKLIAQMSGANILANNGKMNKARLCPIYEVVLRAREKAQVCRPLLAALLRSK